MWAASHTRRSPAQVYRGSAFSGGPRNSTCHRLPNALSASWSPYRRASPRPARERRRWRQGRADLDELARGRVGDVDERVGRPAGRGYDVTGISRESVAVHLEQVAAFEHVTATTAGEETSRILNGTRQKNGRSANASTGRPI